MLHERDEWLMANRQAIDEKIRRGVEELERGEGIPQGEPAAYLERLKKGITSSRQRSQVP
jgi:hypothetical protein